MRYQFHYFILLIIFFLIAFNSYAQFEHRFGSDLADRARAVLELQSGDILIAGHTEGFGAGGNTLLIKTNPQGEKIWIKDYFGINVDEIHSIYEIPTTQNLIICGTTHSFGFGVRDGFVMQTNSEGEVIWAKVYGNIYIQNFYQILPTAFGRYYVCGRSGLTSNNGHAIVMKIDDFGNIFWIKGTDDTIGSGDWTGIGMTATTDGGVVMATHNGNNSTAALYKFDDAGNLMWSQNISPSPSGSGLQGISLTENEGQEILLFFGLSNSQTVAESKDFWIAKFSSVGELIWVNSYGGTYTEGPRKIITTNDNGLAVVGITNSAGNGAEDVCLLKLTNQGEIEWAKAYGGAWNDRASCFFQSNDGSFVITGQTFPFSSDVDSSKVYLIKTDSFGNGPCSTMDWNLTTTSQNLTLSVAPTLTTHTLDAMPFNWQTNERNMYFRNMCLPVDIDENSIEFNLQIFPNPASNFLNISSIIPLNGILNLFDLNGRLLKSMNVSNVTSIRIEIEELAAGLIILEANVNHNTFRQKVLKYQ
jgi:hypothetical protein